MTFSAFLFQALNGLSSASGLFFIAVGLSLIFGVTRIINIAHASLYMLGTYIAYSFATKIGGALGFWGGIVATALVVGVIGGVIGGWLSEQMGFGLAVWFNNGHGETKREDDTYLSTGDLAGLPALFS